MLNETPQGILVVDDEDVVLFANLAMNVLFLPNPMTVGSRIGADPALAGIVRLVEDARGQCTRVEGDVCYPDPYASERSGERHYHVSAAPWSEGGRNGVWVMVDDVTERIGLEQARREFVTNAGHELRTPLSLIHGYIETLKSGMIKNAASLGRCFDVMEKHSRRMMRIIDNMLTISRLEGSDEPLKVDTFLVRGCVQDVLEHLNPLIEVRQPVITLDFPPDGGLLSGDRFYWDQIFSNLIENALKENPCTGLSLKVVGRWTKHECIITVEDDGVGIPAEEVPFVFKRFYRCAKDHSEEVRGTGMGLSIVRRAVEAHGGSIELESRPGVSTVFTIRVPLPD
ncbi:ATP-binding protein [Prosthecobacter sp.]|uniref:ATP-binding protein n=1 Tax=Prosthecobacter sp. TaxID=1965333 RepID=UPI001DB4EAA7|nr:ATP-binding protein [Prosthecobacter sp.]MCB1276965.1 PAS domain-containing protein [Prosthecobacter sp.]